jgi:hypothetical protein
MGWKNRVEEISAHRLGGEPVPADVAILLSHEEGLAQLTGIELNSGKKWAPWLDTSYLTPKERANPDIAANVRAIADVCGMIAFIAAREDDEYFGYWRGTNQRVVAESPIVRLDNEGQFSFCGGSTFAEALLSQSVDDEQFAEWRDWLESVGIKVRVRSLRSIKYPREQVSPDKLHKELYVRYLG